MPEAWNRAIFLVDAEHEQRGAEHERKQRRLTPLVRDTSGTKLRRWSASSWTNVPMRPIAFRPVPLC
jgi:hypothetical protein